MTPKTFKPHGAFTGTSLVQLYLYPVLFLPGNYFGFDFTTV